MTEERRQTTAYRKQSMQVTGAYSEGRECYLNGGDLIECPYTPFDNPFAVNWRQGFKDEEGLSFPSGAQE